MTAARPQAPVPRKRAADGPNLTAGMLDWLGRDIVAGRYEAERVPTEHDLARRHGVSRCVPREAMKMLAAKGLLRARPRNGATVQPSSSWNLFDTDVLRWIAERQFSLELLRQLTELRMAIEPEAAALAAARADTVAVAAIAAAYRRMEEAEAGAGDPVAADIAFHMAVLEAPANPFYRHTGEVVATALQTSIPFTNAFSGRTASLPAHRAVLDAIVAGDPAGARNAMAVIVGEVLELLAQAAAC